MRFETTSILYVRLELEDGLHIYGNPLPEGFIASEASIPQTKGLRVAAAIYPETELREFVELGVTLPVYEGVVDHSDLAKRIHASFVETRKTVGAWAKISDQAYLEQRNRALGI